MTSIKRIIAATIIAGLASTAALAATTAPDMQSHQGAWWLNLGGGFGRFDQKKLNSEANGGPAWSASANYMPTEHSLVTVRFVNVTGVRTRILDEIFGRNTSTANTSDFSALYGYINKGQNGYWSASAGLGLVHTESEEITLGSLILQAKETNNTIGVPLEIQTFWTPTQHFGLGLIGFANLNSKSSFAGVLLALQVGHLD